MMSMMTILSWTMTQTSTVSAVQLCVADAMRIHPGDPQALPEACAVDFALTRRCPAGWP